MNGNLTTSNQTVITYVTATVCFLAIVCVVTFCILSFYGIEVSQGFSILTGGLVGSLTSMLVKTTPTETTKQPLPTPPTLPPTKDHPLPTQVMNEAKNPVPITEEEKGK